MPRICFVGTEITPSEGKTFVGSHVNTILRLSKGLSNMGWEVNIVTSPSRFIRDTDFKYSSGKIHLINVRGKYGSLKYGVDFLIKAINTIKILHQKESFDIVHSHSSFFSMAAIPIFIKKKLGITAIHSLYSPARFLPTNLIPNSLGIKYLSSKLDKIIAVTNNVKNSLIECNVREDKIEIIPLCVDTDLYNTTAYAKEQGNPLKGQSRTRTILYVGSSEKVKGLDIFLDTAELILKQYPRVKFIITLHEPYERIKKVGKIASLKLGSQVQVLGIVKNMPELISRVDVVIVPFRNTSNISDIPLIVLEAMAIGRPVVTSNIGGTAELVHDGENGLIVSSNQASHFADAVIFLLRNPKIKKEIGEKAAASIPSKYAHRNVTMQISNLYQQFIG